MLRDAIRAAARHRGPSIWRKLLGWSCVILGIPGLILPIIPGIPLLVLGIVLLASQHLWAHNALEWAKRRLHWTRLHLHDDEPQTPAREDRDKPLDAREQP
jgi:Putative transmembrane protein (PGPGW)